MRPAAITPPSGPADAPAAAPGARSRSDRRRGAQVRPASRGGRPADRPGRIRPRTPRHGPPRSGSRARRGSGPGVGDPSGRATGHRQVDPPAPVARVDGRRGAPRPARIGRGVARPGGRARPPDRRGGRRGVLRAGPRPPGRACGRPCRATGRARGGFDPVAPRPGRDHAAGWGRAGARVRRRPRRAGQDRRRDGRRVRTRDQGRRPRGPTCAGARGRCRPGLRRRPPVRAPDRLGGEEPVRGGGGDRVVRDGTRRALADRPVRLAVFR